MATPEQSANSSVAVMARYDLPGDRSPPAQPSRACGGERFFAAYDAGCRRFDSAIGGLGRMPVRTKMHSSAHSTEKVIEALKKRGRGNCRR